jgi:hypothetical protein
MPPFEPLGETARWRILYEHLCGCEVGATVKYSTLAELLGLNPVTDRHTIQVAMARAGRELEQVEKHAVEAVVNVGYRVVEPEEHLRLARYQQRKSSKALVRGRSKVVNVPTEFLAGADPQVRAVFEAVALAFQMQQEFNRRTDVRQKRLEESLDSVRHRSDRTDDEIDALRARLEKLEREFG